MALPFARSTRALHTDRSSPALIVLVLAILLLGLWMAWFFWSSITLYETGQIVGATRRGTLVAAFPARVGARMQPGQLAVLKRQDNAEQPATNIPAVLMEVRNKVVDGQIQVDLAPLLDQEAVRDVLKDFRGQVDVAVEQISPAQMIWRAAGQEVNTAAVSVDPQTR